MFPAARVLLPVSVSVFLVIYRYLRSGGRTEIPEDVSPNPGNNDVVSDHRNSPPQLGSPPSLTHHPSPSDPNPPIPDEVRSLDPAVLDWIRSLDPSVLDQILKLCLKGEEEEEAEGSCNGRGNTENENENANKNEKEDERQSDGGGGEENKNENGGEVEKNVVEGSSRRHQYPVRPGDCFHYLKTGTCKFGSNCKFNHPRRRTNNQVSKDKTKERDELAEKPGQKERKFKFRSGGCEYGKASSFNHDRGEPSVAPILKLNFVGLPIRPGKRECSPYMQSGSCMYGTDCWLNHPDPIAAGESDPPFEYGNGGPASLQGALSSTAEPWSAPKSLTDTPIYAPMMIPPSQGIPSQNTERNGYQVPAYLPVRSMPAPPPYVMNNSETETNIHEQYPQQKQVEELPERPGQPVIHFSRTGDCKFKSECKYHHPKNQTAVSPSCALSDKALPLRPAPTYLPERSMPAPPPYVMNNSETETNIHEQYPQQKQVEELPERPGQPVCIYFSRTGDCKFKSECKYHHPKNQTAVPPSCALSDKGLPLRPGQNICTPYHRYGICNSGAACIFDHPSL